MCGRARPLCWPSNLGTAALIFTFTPFVTQIGLQFWFLAGALHGLVAGRGRARFMTPWLLASGDFVPLGGMDTANHALASYLARRSNGAVHLVAHRVVDRTWRHCRRCACITCLARSACTASANRC